MLNGRRLGLIGYLNFTGLGAMNQDLMTQFEFDCHLVVPGEDKGHYPHLARAKENVWAERWTPSDEELERFFERVDVVVTIETDFKCGLFEKARRAGVRTVLLPMWEWFDPKRLGGADVFVATSKMTRRVLEEDGFGERTTWLPWPVDTERQFRFKRRGTRGNLVFVHNAGFGGLNWRKGTLEVVEAFAGLEERDATLLLRSQRPWSEYPLEVRKVLDEDQRIVVDEKFYDRREDMYEDGDVYLYPARYDGQALVAEEALACGLPTFVTDAPPMNEFACRAGLPALDMAVRVKSSDPVRIYNRPVPLCVCDVDDLRKKMRIAVGMDLAAVADEGRSYIETEYSWRRWWDGYAEVFAG